MGNNFWWTADGWVNSNPRIDLPTQVLAAESFLVRDHRVAGWDLHAQRFSASLAARNYPLEEFCGAAPAPWRTLAELIPAEGRYFPKVDAHLFADGHVQVEAIIRPAPAPLLETRVYASNEQFEMVDPSIKGPDLELGLELRARAQVRGYGEWIRLTPGGYVLEGALTALMWWRDGTLHVPPLSLKRVDSITLKLVRKIAAERQVAVVEELVKPADLAGTDLWIASSLHGIRSILGWDSDCGESPELQPNQDRLDSWQQAWKSQAQPIGAG